MNKNKKNAAVTLPGKELKKSFPLWLWLVGIIALTVAVYFPCFNNGFTNWDDTMYVTSNGLIRSFCLNNILACFKTLQVQGNYHPITVLSFTIDYALFGLNPSGYHTVNMLLHVLSVCIVFALMQKLFKSEFITIVTALLFAIHPMHVESVAWVSERKDLLYALFYLSGLWCYVNYSDKKKTVFLGFTVICFILSLLSKAQAVTFPLALLIIDYIRNGRLSVKDIIRKTPWLVLSLLAGVVAIYAQQTTGSLSMVKNYSLGGKILLAGYAFAIYVIKFFVPVKLAANYPYPHPVDGWYNPLIYLSLIIPLAFAVGMVLVRKNRIIVSGLLFFILNIALVLKVLAVGDALLAERYTYLSYLGLFWALAYCLNYVIQKMPRFKLIALTCCGVYFIFLAYTCFGRTQIWRNDLTLWNDELAQFNNVAPAWGNLGNYYLANHNIDSAKICFNRAVLSDTNNDIALSDRSYVYYLTGRYDSAVHDANRAIHLQPGNKDAHQNRGVAFVATGKADGAIPDDTWLIAQDPMDSTAHLNRGYAYLYANKNDSAFADFNWAVIHCPHNAEAYKMRATVNTLLNNLDASLNDFSKAIDLDPTDWTAYGNRSYAYLLKGDNEKTVSDATIAIDHLPQNSIKNYLINRANAYYKLGYYSEALQDYSVLQKMGIMVDSSILSDLEQKIASR